MDRKDRYKLAKALDYAAIKQDLEKSGAKSKGEYYTKFLGEFLKTQDIPEDYRPSVSTFFNRMRAEEEKSKVKPNENPQETALKPTAKVADQADELTEDLEAVAKTSDEAAAPLAAEPAKATKRGGKAKAKATKTTKAAKTNSEEKAKKAPKSTRATKKAASDNAAAKASRGPKASKKAAKDTEPQTTTLSPNIIKVVTTQQSADLEPKTPEVAKPEASNDKVKVKIKVGDTEVSLYTDTPEESIIRIFSALSKKDSK